MSARRSDHPVAGISPEIALLVRILDESYERKAWHGPNLKGSIRGLTPAQALWRPQAGRHCIAEHVIHAAYWKYAVRRRLDGGARGTFPLRGSNWFAVESLSADEWRRYVALLDAQHRALRETILNLPAERLTEVPPGAKIPNAMTVSGIASHDVYHAGQIQLLKRLQGRTREP